ncbi:hypothetical protein EYC80_009078 [Monilinia laxa]|uniref:Uncharacterized protein n=1 Tax=Monilinia laxa TaxID=61186 RepID=A0A5N6K2U2_MONLA|nr:hypothetical protein EYC80_009078 [Monilinia laxa]
MYCHLYYTHTCTSIDHVRLHPYAQKQLINLVYRGPVAICHSVPFYSYIMFPTPKKSALSSKGREYNLATNKPSLNPPQSVNTVKE